MVVETEGIELPTHHAVWSNWVSERSEGEQWLVSYPVVEPVSASTNRVSATARGPFAETDFCRRRRRASFRAFALQHGAPARVETNASSEKPPTPGEIYTVYGRYFISKNNELFVVGATGIEPVTPTMSRSRERRRSAESGHFAHFAP